MTGERKLFIAGTRTIKQKIILGTAVNCVLALMLAFISLIIYNRLSHRSGVVEEYQTLVKILESTNRSDFARGDFNAIKSNTAGILMHKPEVISAAVYDRNGKIFAKYVRADEKSVAFPPAEFTETMLSQSFWSDLFYPITAPDGKNLLGVQHIRISNTAFAYQIGHYVTLFLILIPLPVSIAILLALFLQRSMARPLAELGEAAKQISEKRNFNTRIKSIPHDEIGVLAKEFNDMLLEIQKYDTDQKNIVQLLEQRIKERVKDLRKESVQRKRAEKRERELQKRLDRSQRMESLGILAGGVAHDLNNILGPIVGYTDLLLSQVHSDPKFEEDIEAIHNAALRAAAVIQDLLTLARRGNYKLMALSLQELIGAYLNSPEFIEKQVQHERVTVHTEISPKTPGVKASDVHLHQVFMNLTINALEAMPDGGKLTIKASGCRIQESKVVYTGTLPPGRYAVVQIIDTGEGIKKSDTEHIFEPFYTKKQMGKSGTGLGLAIVYGIVSDLNGYIDLETKPGVGTEFTLYFPATSYKKMQERKQQKLQKGHERILIVDDNDEQRALAKKLLTHLGYEVFSINSGSKALGVVQNNEFDLIVMDMILDEDLDGLDTIQAILKYKPRQRFVVATGFAESERLEHAKELVNATYIAKPFTLQSLGDAVRAGLDRKSKVEY
ncbi:MAG: response regulator [Calditrichaeota bacterium]|nr:MAG: response regulator [Calditrichota bacterium]